MSDSLKKAEPGDPSIRHFLQHLSLDRGASIYTQRNYSQALAEFHRWYHEERRQSPAWDKLERDDFRSYVRFLGRNNLSRAAIQLRFSALRSFYKFLIRRGMASKSPIKNLALPKIGKRLPKFLTAQQMNDLLNAPLQLLPKNEKKKRGRPIETSVAVRDAAILETIYSCGLRISELCGLTAADIDFNEQLLRVLGKGKKERLVPIGQPALQAIEKYWQLLPQWPVGNAPVFLASAKKNPPLSPRVFQLRLKKYLMIAGLDPTLTPHKLRHTYATLMLNAGADLRSVQELLGHAHLVTTQIYTHVSTERLKRAYDDAHPRAK
ncbi:MAG: tyrosine recombinase XerC [Verrucomicrobiota bacterium]|nr:tyrosine recombinase XerC [Verrucomicrobiota bacterium]